MFALRIKLRFGICRVSTPGIRLVVLTDCRKLTYEEIHKHHANSV